MAKFEIGHQFIRRGTKARRVETVVDILTTTNSSGAVVKTEYLVAHEFMGQQVHDTVVGTTIAMGEQVKPSITE